MTAKEIMAELESMGSESIRNILMKHGVREPLFGVKVEHLKTIQKKIKKDYQLAKDLYATGNADAMYLAGLIADDEKMTKTDLQTWVGQALSQNISEYTVPWVAAGSKHGYELALEWIDSPEEHIATAGWATLGGLVALKQDANLDLPALRTLLARVVKTISSADIYNRVRHAMIGFVISVGAYSPTLTDDAIDAAKKIGGSKGPDALAYIEKMKARGTLRKKKKTVKC